MTEPPVLLGEPSLANHRAPCDSRSAAGRAAAGRAAAALPIAAWLIAALLAASSVSAQTIIRTFDNTTSGAIPFTSGTVDDNPPVNCPAGTNLTRTFSVGDSFTVAGVALGLRYDHIFREDVVAVLESPAGTRVTVLNNTASDPDDNLDAMFSPDAEVTGPDDGDGDNTGEPFYHRELDVDGLTAFNGQGSQGTWTLYLCDDFAADDGTFLSARLVLQEAGSQLTVCASTVTYDWGTNGDIAAFTSATFADITLTETSTTDFFGYAIADRAFVTRTTTQGGHAGYYGFGFDVGAAVAPDTNGDESGGQAAVFTFDPPIRDLTFDLLDVDFLTGDDAADGGFEDLVRIRPRDANGDLIPYQTQDADGGTDPDLVGELWEGDVTAAPTATTNNPRFFIAGPLSELTLEYFSGDFPNFPADQFIGIADFVLCAYDFGDAPASYQTALGGGPRHVLGDRDLYLGTTPPDGEGDGQPVTAGADNTGANGDGLDEEGVTAFPSSSTLGGTYTVPVTVTNDSGSPATLCGWFDSGQDGTFESDEAVCVTVPASGSNADCSDGGATFSCSLAFTVPVADRANSGDFYFRFRVTTDSLTTGEPGGAKDDGEVEDYRVAISSLPVSLAAFESELLGDQVRIQWQTASETSNVGFRLYDGEGRRLHERLIPGRSLESFAPQSYVATVPRPKSDEIYLTEVGRRGEEAWYGPFRLGERHGRKLRPRPVPWSALRQELATADTARRNLGSATEAEIRVDEDGLYRFTHRQLVAAGIDLSGIPAAELALWNPEQGNVARRVRGGALFGEGSEVVFYGEALAESLYGDTNVYFFGHRPERARAIEQRRATPWGRGETHYRERLEIDRQRHYSFASPTGDPWFETRLLAPGGESQAVLEIELEDLVAGEDGHLDLLLWGVTDWPGEGPDHHLVATFNGHPLFDRRFDGLSAQRLQATLPAAWLQEGVNRLELTLPGDTGYDFDLVHVDRYALEFSRRLIAQEDRLAFTGGRQTFDVGGFSEGRIEAFVRDDQGLAELVGAELSSDLRGGRIWFQGNPGRGASSEYLLTTPAGYRRPTLAPRRSVAPDLVNRRADYLVVSHSAFADHLGPLLAARRADGWNPHLVTIEDLFAAYSGSRVDPEAVRRYLREMTQVRAVLLVGGDTYDYRDHLGLGSLSFVPSPYRATDGLVRYAPVDPLYGDLDDDGLPEIAVGRWPVRSVAELDRVMAKTLAFPSARASALLVADDDPGARYGDSIGAMASRLAAPWSHHLVTLDGQSVGDARGDLLARFDEAPGLVAFVGHSGPSAWTFDGLFRTSDVDALANHQSPALVAQWGCWNTYHVAPRYDTLGHRLLLAGPQGAAAVVGAAALTEASLETLMGPDFVAQLMVPGRTLGEAMVTIKRELARQRPGQADILLGWTLLGDPALTMPTP